MIGEAQKIKALAKSMFSLVISLPCIARMRSLLEALAIERSTIEMQISNFRCNYVILRDAYYKWIYHSNKRVTTVTTTLIPNIATYNQRRITTEFWSALEVRLQS